MHHLCQEGYTGILGASHPDLFKQGKVKIDIHYIYLRRAKIVRISTSVQFGPFLTVLDHFDSLDHFGPFWTVWTILDRLDHSGPFWTLLDRLGHS